MVTREKRTSNLGCDGGMKPTKIDVNIEILVIMPQCHKVYGGGQIKGNLLKKGLQAVKVRLKRERDHLSCR